MPPSTYRIDRRVLQVRHLPRAFTQAQSTDLLRKHGASTVTFKKGSAFAFFEDQLQARQALQTLHQLHLNEAVLLVTFARSDDKSIPLMPPVSPLPDPQLAENEEVIRRIHAVAPDLGLNYILNPIIRYKYPPINDTILANICEALRNNSSFYTQVLHLMNKMCMVPPFRRMTAPREVFRRPSRETSTQMTSESESDLSDVEDLSRHKRQRLRPQPLEIVRRPIRKPKTDISPTIMLPESAPVDVNQCFDIAPVRRVEIAKITPTVHQTANEEIVTGEGFGRLDPTQPEKPRTVFDSSRFDFKNLEPFDLDSVERLPIQDSIDHPAFRNYEVGDPTERLYVKNLHRSATEDDLFRLFGSLVPLEEPELAAFDIKLMKFGRMREQAFVTFGSVSTSSKALELTNRLFLKGKPMSVQFAKD